MDETKTIFYQFKKLREAVANLRRLILIDLGFIPESFPQSGEVKSNGSELNLETMQQVIDDMEKQSRSADRQED